MKVLSSSEFFWLLRMAWGRLRRNCSDTFITAPLTFFLRNRIIPSAIFTQLMRDLKWDPLKRQFSSVPSLSTIERIGTLCCQTTTPYSNSRGRFSNIGSWRSQYPSDPFLYEICLIFEQYLDANLVDDVFSESAIRDFESIVENLATIVNLNANVCEGANSTRSFLREIPQFLPSLRRALIVFRPEDDDIMICNVRQFASKRDEKGE